MTHRIRHLLVSAALGLCAGSAAAAPSAATPPWDVTAPRGVTREVDFNTTEGTGMSVDISPDGRWLLFDLLAQVYRVPVGGGPSECLTADSGIALNYHPRY
jgi:hypothetical protein